MTAQPVGSRWGDLLARGLGWRAGMLLEPVVFDRWWWMRRLIAPGARTLDAGCGSGWFALYLASRGSETVGISFDRAANEAARRRARALGASRVTILDGDLRDLDRFGAELGNFEQVICFETVEHIRDDRKLVNDLALRLRPGGRLLITTPSLDHRSWIGEDIDPDEGGAHVRRGYAVAQLAELVESAGLTPIEHAHLSGIVSHTALDLKNRLSAIVGHRLAALLTIPLRLLRPLDRPLTERLGFPYTCVAVLATKR